MHDPDSGTAKAIIKLSEQKGQLVGHIVDIYCTTECDKNADLFGQKVVWGLKPKNAKEWHKGELLDAYNEKQYRAALRRISAKKMALRAYLGFSFFGKTIELTRTTEPLGPTLSHHWPASYLERRAKTKMPAIAMQSK